jgi:uncharacterized protein YdhG (YjbR/CyaY superfamily)
VIAGCSPGRERCQDRSGAGEDEEVVVGEVTEYVGTLSGAERDVVSGLLDRVGVLVPEAEEGTSYGLAAYRYRGRPLVTVAVGARGCTAYPFSSDVTASVLATLDGFDATKGGIRFTVDRPLPPEAFDALVRERRAQIDAALDRPKGRKR